MSSHFKFYPGSEEVVIPWNARYSFPSQANKSIKITPRIPPKNGATFTPGETIRFEFPAQGYVNTAATTLAFDFDLTGHGEAAKNDAGVWIQNNVQSAFSRVRLLYGANPIEDMINYNQIVRNLTEWTSTNNNNFDQFSIAEGIGRVRSSQDGGNTHARITQIQAVLGSSTANLVPAPKPSGNGYTSRRRYQVQLALGLLTQGKLLPTKWMASQLAIEITLASKEEVLLQRKALFVTSGTPVPAVGTANITYSLTNLSLIPEILEFDASYDALFLKGLQDGGVPLKFNKWHTFTHQLTGAYTNIMIQERSRSIKAIFAVIRRAAKSFEDDSGATFGSVAAGMHMQSYQYRIGGRYFPASPVQVNYNQPLTDTTHTGSCEAYLELAKALSTVGDYRLSCSVNAASWNMPFVAGTIATSVGEADGLGSIIYSTGATVTAVAYTGGIPANQLVPASDNSGVFCMATCLETTNGAEVSGLNAEEQSDITLMINWSVAPPAGFIIETYVLYDALLILKPNNVMELIE